MARVARVMVAGGAGLVAALALCGCAGMPDDDRAATGSWRAPGPFAGESVSISGLTRLDRRADDEVVLVLHLEVRDGFGDPVKVVGAVDVVLTPAASAQARADAVRWTVPFWDPRTSTSFYDPSSRTYRLVLGDLPAWLREMDAADARAARLDVVVRTPAPGTGDRAVRELRAQTTFSG